MRATACFSMYSDMSTRIMALSSSNRYCARARTSSVLPTPVGPRKMKLPMGRLGSLRPARLRRMAFETRRTASSWPTTRSFSRSGMWTSFWISPSIMRVTGMPVHLATMRAISSSPISSLRSAVSFTASSSCSAACNVLFDLREPAVAQLGGLLPIAGAGGLLLFLAQAVLLLLQLAHARDGALLAVPALLQAGGFAAQPLELVFDVAQPVVRRRVLLLAQAPGARSRGARCAGPGRRSRWAWSRSAGAARSRLRRSGRSPYPAGSGRRCSGARARRRR